MNNETNSNRDGRWHVDGNVAPRTSNVGDDEISGVLGASRAHVSTGTSTPTNPAEGGTGPGSRNGGSAMLMAIVAVVESPLERCRWVKR